MDKKPSIVLEIQRLSAEPEINITEILRKSLIVATKLNLEDFRKWISDELYGYKDLNIPNYRQLHADIKLKNPYHGLIPVTFDNKELAERLRKVYMCQPIGELESLKKEPQEGGYISVPFSYEEERFLLNYQGRNPLPPVRIIYHTQIIGIINAIQDFILDWSLRLEAQGILGEGMSFSQEDKQKAHTANVHIENFQGILGDVYQKNGMSFIKGENMNIDHSSGKTSIEKVSNSMINVSSHLQNVSQAINGADTLPKEVRSKLAELFEQLKQELESVIQKNDGDIEDAEWAAEVAEALANEVVKQEPNPSFIEKYHSRLKKIGEGIGSSLIAQIIFEIGKLLLP